MTVLRSGSATHVGRVRNTNQDCALEAGNLFAVADGMGGHAGGEVAARVALDSLRLAFDRQPTLEGLRQAAAEANATVWQESQLNPDLRGMGTTLTAAGLVTGDEGRDVVGLVNVGDSRAYVYSGGRLTQVTSDHSLAQEKVRHGQLTEAQAAVHPHRHILTRALGVAPGVDVDLWELRLRSGDRLLICSDGLTNEVGINQITEVLDSVVDPHEAAEVLVRTANEHGGSDNITVVVVDVLVGDQSAAGGATVVAPVAGSVSGAALVVAADPSPSAIDPGDAEPMGQSPGAGTTGGGRARGSRGNGAAAPSDVAATGVVAATSAGPFGFEDETGVVPSYGGAATDDLFLGPATGVAVAERPVEELTPPPPPLQKERKETRRERRRRLGIPRRVTFRVIGFLLLLLAVVAAAYLLVRWWATDDWYVTVQHNELVVYQGRPGGILWFHPKLVDKTGVTTSQILSIHLPALEGDVQEASLVDAQSYVRNLKDEYLAQQQAGTGTTKGPAVGPSGALPTLPPAVSSTSSSTTTSTTAPGAKASTPASTTTTTPTTTTTTTTPTTTTTTSAPPPTT
ncbi:MAG TPA: Stp1/IreP family PP2C-type Ser/Thr phosphatase [Acidimicrobiales bacterium]|nr:Stp1/IreP family PP2C-type Ser/Thr phosphatase [Acidimicrobiales bacterium]